jgi:hypothetical protein
MKIYKNIHLVGSSATGGLKPSELAEICRKGQRVGNTISIGKIKITLTNGKKGDLLIKDVSL